MIQKKVLTYAKDNKINLSLDNKINLSLDNKEVVKNKWEIGMSKIDGKYYMSLFC